MREVLFVLLILVSGNIWADPPWSANVKISDDPGTANQNEVSIWAYRNFVYGCWNDARLGGWKTFFARSTDRGSTWSANVRIAPDSATGGSVGDGALCTNEAGELFVVIDDFSNNRIWLSKSTNNGVSFLPSVRCNGTVIPIDKSWVYATGNRVYVPWDYAGSPVGIWLNRSTNSGSSFGTPQRIDKATSGGTRWGPVPRELPSGTILVSWGEDSRSGIDTVNYEMIARSTDGGANFTEYIVARAKFRQSGGTPRIFTLPPLEYNPRFPQDVYMVYNDSRAITTGSSDYNLDVFFVRSTNEGVTWSTPLRINDDSTTSADTMRQFMPWMDVDPYGTIHVVFYDARRQPPRSNRLAIYYTYSTNRGLTWATNERVTDTSFVAEYFMGDYIGCHADSQYVYAAWSDRRAGNPDIYFSRRIVPVGVSQEVQIIPQSKTLQFFRSYPNPAKRNVNLRYEIPHKGLLTMKIYNIAGQLVRTLYSGEVKAGVHTLNWNGENERGIRVADGIYFVELKFQNYPHLRERVVLLR